MAGCSVVVLMLIFAVLAAVVVPGVVLYVAYAYIFESLFCARQCRRPILGWIPLWNQYVLARAAGMKQLGIALVVNYLAILICAIYWGWMLHLGEPGSIWWMVAFAAMAMVLKLVIARKIYRQARPDTWKKFHLAGVLTLGIAQPALLFAVRKDLN